LKNDTTTLANKRGNAKSHTTTKYTTKEEYKKAREV
jgi:hypothetical protein